MVGYDLIPLSCAVCLESGASASTLAMAMLSSFSKSAARDSKTGARVLQSKIC